MGHMTKEQQNKHRWVPYMHTYIHTRECSGCAWTLYTGNRAHQGPSLMWYGPAKWIKLIVIPTAMKSPRNVFTSNQSVSTSALLYMVPDRRSGHSWLFIEFRLRSLMARADINVGQATFGLSIYLKSCLRRSQEIVASVITEHTRERQKSALDMRCWKLLMGIKDKSEV